jgi:hypothetical protein
MSDPSTCVFIMTASNATSAWNPARHIMVCIVLNNFLIVAIGIDGRSVACGF